MPPIEIIISPDAATMLAAYVLLLLLRRRKRGPAIKIDIKRK